MRLDDPVFRQLNEADTKEPRFVVRILFDVDSISITSHDDIEDVPGTVISNALVEPNLVSQLIKPDEAASEIGSASFELDDTDGVFTAEVNERLLDGVGLRRKRVEFYLGYKGLSFLDFRLSGTQEIAEVELENGRYSISCLDIQRALRTDILSPKETTIRESITASQTTIPLTNADDFNVVFHGPSYSDAPSTSVGYIRIKKEIIRYTGKTDDDLTGCTRAVFGTTAEAYTVDSGAPAEKREKVTEFIYLELPSLKLAYALLTGVLYNDGMTLPDHWHLGIDESLLVVENFIDKLDLWDPNDELKGLILRFLDVGKQDGKRFLEKEVYLASGLYSPIDVQGRIGIRRMNKLIGAAATALTIDATNATNASQLTHEMDSIHNSFSVLWSYDIDSKEFRRETRFVDPDSFTVHGASPLFQLQFKGLTSARHTDGVIFGILDMVRERYAGPPITMSVELLHSVNRIEIGDVVRVRFPHLKDFNSAAGTLDRPMEVQRVRCNHRTGRLQVDLFATTATPAINSPTDTGGSPALNDGFYTSEGTALSAATGITIVSNAITAATSPLAGSTDVTAPASIYYHNGNLTLNAGVILNITGNVQIRVKGFFTINGEIRGIGGGHLGITDDGGSLFTLNDTAQAGRGYVGNSKSAPGFYCLRVGSQIAYFLQDILKVIGQNSSAPNLLLQSDGSTVTGLPSDLQGTGGPQGGRVGAVFPSTPVPYPSGLRGGAGGSGGAGLLLICRGSGMGVNGKIDLSGASGSGTSAGSAATINGNGGGAGTALSSVPGPGGAGSPGTMYVLLDGSGISVPDYGNKFVARTGTVSATGGNVIDPQFKQRYTTFTEPVSVINPDDPPISNLDLSGACLRFQYIPGAEVAAGDLDSKPPSPPGLAATGVELGVELSITVNTFDQIDTVEVFASTTNDRADAGKIYEGRADHFRHQLPGGATRYYWARNRGLPNAQGRRATSDFFPFSPTAGISATSLVGGSGADGQSVEIQYSADGVSFHDTFTTGDVFLRQRIGTGGTYTAPIRFVGEAGAAGATGGTGNYIDFIFKRSATTPATPTGNMPAGWSQTPPASDGNPLFVCRGEKQSGTNSLIGTWSAPQILVEDGEPGLPGAQGPALFTWTGATAGIVTTPSGITRTSGSGFNAGAYSLQSYTDGSFCSARSLITIGQSFFGLNTDPATDANFTSIDFAWYYFGDGHCFVYESGVFVADMGTYTTSTVLAIVHNGPEILYYKDGALVRTVTGQAGKRFFLDTCIASTNSGLQDVAFGPSGGKGATGAQGAPAKVLRLTSSAQAFTFTSAGLPNPTSQTITFTVTRSNISSLPAFTTTPNGVTLNGTVDTRTLTVADFGGNNQVKVTATSEGFSDEITVFRLLAGAPGAAGQSAIVGFLTNEAHTLAADPDGTVQNFSGANGLFKVFQGVGDVSDSANYSVQSFTSGITAQINTADNTPIAGQPRGFYRVTGMSVDSGSVNLLAAFGAVQIVKTFSLVKSRQGQPGDGANLIRPSVWVIGTQGSQGTVSTPSRGTLFQANGLANESAIVLGGADGISPVGPFGVSEPLWRCLPSGDSGPDGGWDTLFSYNHAKTHRFFVWAYFEKLSGAFYLGCSGAATRDLVSGSLNNNPYFVGFDLNLFASVLSPRRWYGVVGIIHGSTYNGSSSGIAGIYDKESGVKIVDGVEFLALAASTEQDHRCYHFTDTDTTNRQYMCRPRVDEINGNEPNLLQLLGLQSVGPYIARNGCRVSGSSFIKESGSSGWNADVQSIQGYDSAFVQWKASQTDKNVMLGLNSDPLTDTSFSSLDAAWHASTGGACAIYENGNQVSATLPYGTSTEFAITFKDGIYRYFLDKVQVRSVSGEAGRKYLDSSFFEIGSACKNVRFGPGGLLEGFDTGDLSPGAVSEILSTNILFGQGELLPTLSFDGGPNGYDSNIGFIAVGARPFAYSAVCTVVLDAWISTRLVPTDKGAIYMRAIVSAGTLSSTVLSAEQPVLSTVDPGGRVVVQMRVSVPSGAFGVQFIVYAAKTTRAGLEDFQISFRNMDLQVEVKKR